MAQLENIPGALIELDQWVVWRWKRGTKDTKPTKVPYSIRGGKASTTDPGTWGAFFDAVEYARVAGADGLGFVVTKRDPFVGVDLDHCYEDGAIAPWAARIVERLRSYTEITPSGQGLRVWVRGRLPPGRREKAVTRAAPGAKIELYADRRYFTVTGHRLDDLPATIEERTEALAALYAELFPASSPAAPGSEPVSLNDTELINRMLQAKNGQKVWHLWNGNIDAYDNDDSRADLALCDHLAFWCAGDPIRIDRIFRQSKLYRPKWDERRGDRTYGQRTIETALAGVTTQYQPSTEDGTRLRLNGEQQAAARKQFHLTDVGNAERLIARFGQDIRWCERWSRWLVWDGQRWTIDETGNLARYAKATVRALYREAAETADDAERKAIGAHARRSESEGRIRGLIELAKSEPGIAIRPDDLDQNPWLLNVQNGTVDLRTGEIQPHNRANLITKLATATYATTAECPLFERFLTEIMAGQPSLTEFLQRAAGYSLSGSTVERSLLLLYGTGANGKTTLLEVLRSLLGDYAMRTPTEMLLAKRSDAIPNDVARLKGARLVTASEADEGRRFAESLIKDLTGGDTITARFMRAEWFDFRPSFKIWLATNHKPVVRGTDRAIWDRLKLVPFTVRIPDERQDRALLEKLQTELPGILAWAVEGCRLWIANGLGTPQEVQRATESYRQEMDVFGNFLTDCCEVGPGAETTPRALATSYRNWAEANGERPLSARAIALRLQERGFQPRKTTLGKRIWCGLRVSLDHAGGGQDEDATGG